VTFANHPSQNQPSFDVKYEKGSSPGRSVLTIRSVFFVFAFGAGILSIFAVQDLLCLPENLRFA
jgi:hypothetical protein